VPKKSHTPIEFMTNNYTTNNSITPSGMLSHDIKIIDDEQNRQKPSEEIAVSLKFKWSSNHPNIVINTQTNQEYCLDDIKTKILIYEDCVKNWFFHYGHKLKTDYNAGFIILQIAISQIEGVEQYQCGNSSQSNSKITFRAGFKKIFSSINVADSLIDEFYIHCRCGLLHDGMTRPPVKISEKFTSPFEYKDNYIQINPQFFFDAVSDYFDNYIEKLKNPSKNKFLLDNFEKIWQLNLEHKFNKINLQFI